MSRGELSAADVASYLELLIPFQRESAVKVLTAV